MHTVFTGYSVGREPGPEVIKIVLNSAEHKFFPAHEC